jgi:truncated hemoglobin YjbI
LDEDRCRVLSAAFYARVGKDPVLKPLFPGKSLRCATEEFAAFLIQFLGGDEEQTQKRWWLSLRESHARFSITAAQRAAWLRHMSAALDEVVPGDAAFRQFFLQSSSYVVGGEAGRIEDRELAERWDEQLALDAAVARGEPETARRFAGRRSVFVGLLARMMQSGHADFVVDALGRDVALRGARFGGRTLLHYACGAGCVEVVAALLRMGVDPDIEDHGGHTPLYRVANECGSAAGPEIVRMLVAAGADVDARGGVTRSTPLHMAARRGFVDIARILIDRGADTGAVDRKGDTPLQRAINCRKSEVARLIADRNR